MKNYSSPKYLLLGEVLRPHGIYGELRVRVLTDYPERISTLKYIYLGRDANTGKHAQRHTVQQVRMHQSYVLLKLKDVDDRNRAETLRDLFVMVDIEDAIPLEDDELYLYQLIGMRVQTTDGEHIGEVAEVLETGANDVYIVQGGIYGEVLIPVMPETILNTDIDTRIITVNLPKGLLPE